MGLRTLRLCIAAVLATCDERVSINADDFSGWACVAVHEQVAHGVDTMMPFGSSESAAPIGATRPCGQRGPARQ